MIQGLRVRIPSADLKAHITSRFDYHKQKAEGYEQRLQALSGLAAEQGVSNDPVIQMRSKRDEHQQKAAFFGLMAEYLAPDEVYDLATTDLSTLEFVSRWF